METTVTQLAPSPARVLRQQISLLGSPGSIASLAVALVGVQIIATTTWIAESLRVIEVPVFNLLPFLVMVAAGWPAIVWQAEGPSKR